eukprot:Nk52_evm20s219 gene=Nk52_evmTU20s219
MNRYLSSSFAPANPYESLVIVGSVGGLFLLNDSTLIQNILASLFAGYLSSVVVFSFSNFSSYFPEKVISDGAIVSSSDAFPNAVLGNLVLPVFVKYTFLGVFVTAYMVMAYFRKTRLVALSSFTSTLAGYLLVLGAEFVGLFTSGLFIRMDSLIRIYTNPSAGSLCVFHHASFSDQCFQRHMIWVFAWVAGVLIQLLFGYVISTPPPSCVRPSETPFKSFKDAISKTSSDAKTKRKNMMADLQKNDQTSLDNCSFVEILRSNGIVVTASTSSTLDQQEGSGNRSSSASQNSSEDAKDGIVDIPDSISTSSSEFIPSEPASQPASQPSSAYDVYVNLWSIPDPWLATILLVMQNVALGFVALCIVLTVDWIFSSTLIAIVYVICFVFVSNITLSACLMYMCHYFRHFYKVIRGSTPNTSLDQEPDVFPLRANMKTLGCYCLLSNHKQASADCFRSMYSTFCRNMDPNGNFETAVVSASKDVEIVRHELLLRDVFRVKICKDMYWSLCHLLTKGEKECSVEELLPLWNELCEYNSGLVLAHRLGGEDESNDDNGYYQKQMEWVHSKEDGGSLFTRMTSVWTSVITQHKAKCTANGSDWRLTFRAHAWMFIKKQCDGFMYFHRNSRVLRKPGQYQDLMQLSTWGIDYSYTYAKQHYKEEGKVQARTFGFTGNLINNGRYSKKKFRELRALFEKNALKDFERVKRAGKAGMYGRDKKASVGSESISESSQLTTYGTNESDENSFEEQSGPYSFTLIMDGDTSAPSGSVQRLVQIAFGNTLHGIVQPAIRPGTSYQTLTSSLEQTQLDSICDIFYGFQEKDEMRTVEISIDDSIGSVSISTSEEGVEEDQLKKNEEKTEVSVGRCSTRKRLPICEQLSAEITIPDQSGHMWRARVQDVCVPSTGGSLTSIFGRSFFYGKGLVNNLAYCSALLGTPDRPRDTLPLDVYSHDTYEALFLRPYTTDEVSFIEEPVFNPLAVRYQKIRWTVGEFINACYLFPESVGRFIRFLKAFHGCWLKFKGAFSTKDQPSQSRLKLKSGANEYQDIREKGTPVAANLVKEPIKALSAPLIILLLLTCQTIFVSTERPTPNIKGIYNERQLYDVVINAPTEAKYWFFMYTKNLNFTLALFIFVMIVFLGINVFFKMIDIFFHLSHRVNQKETIFIACRRKLIHFALCLMELFMSVISYPSEIILGSYTALQTIHCLVVGKLKWRPQREVELEMNAISYKGPWTLLKVNMKRGGAFVFLCGVFVLVWLIWLRSFLYSNNSVVIIPIFVVWVGAISCIVYPFWMVVLGMRFSQDNIFVRWLTEIELVLNQQEITIVPGDRDDLNPISTEQLSNK